MVEEWKDIKNYENEYQVSNMGRIRSVTRTINVNGKNQYINYKTKKQYKGKIIKLRMLPSGYVQVCLRKNKKVIYKNVHRLVAQAFIPNPDNLPEVNHLDSNRANNNITNLEWCSSKQNKQHAILYGNRKPKLLQFKEEILEKLKNGEPIRKLAKEYNVSVQPILDIKKGKR